MPAGRWMQRPIVDAAAAAVDARRFMTVVQTADTAPARRNIAAGRAALPVRRTVSQAARYPRALTLTITDAPGRHISTANRISLLVT